MMELMTITVHWAGFTCTDCDFDANETVNVVDLLTLLSNWGKNRPGSPGDVDSDGDVDVRDLTILLDFWGSCPAADRGAA